MVDFGELKDKAEDLAGKHSDQVDGAIDKAADLLGAKFGHQAQVEQGADKLKDMLTGANDGQNDDPKPHGGKRSGPAKKQGGPRPAKKAGPHGAGPRGGKRAP